MACGVCAGRARRRGDFRGEGAPAGLLVDGAAGGLGGRGFELEDALAAAEGGAGGAAAGEAVGAGQ